MHLAATRANTPSPRGCTASIASSGKISSFTWYRRNTVLSSLTRNLALAVWVPFLNPAFFAKDDRLDAYPLHAPRDLDLFSRLENSLWGKRLV